MGIYSFYLRILEKECIALFLEGKYRIWAYIFIYSLASQYLEKNVIFKEILEVVVQLISCAWLFATPWTVACQASLSFTISQGLLKLMSVESVMPSDHVILCYSPLLLPSVLEYQGLLSLLLASGIQSIGATASASSLSNEYSGLISFRVDWFDLLAVQGTLKSLLQYHSSKASVLQCSAFFVVQLTSTHTTGKNVVLTIWTFIGKVMSLLFNILSRFVTAILQFLR